MANMIPISTVTATTSVASLDFVNIPNLYTDLVIKTSFRAVQSTGFQRIRFNSISTTSYAYRWVFGNGTNGLSTNGTDTAINWIDSTNSSDAANAFSNGDIYIFNYTGSQNKVISADVARENNDIAETQGLVSGIWENTSPISSISLYVTSGDLAQYSSATLYGIRKY